VVSFPWHERGRAEAIANAAFQLAERRIDPPSRLLRQIAEAGTQPPEWITDAERHVQAISISGTNGKSTTTRMIAHILLSAGRHVGVTTSDGVIVDDVVVEEGDLTGPMGAQSVLRNKAVDVAVLETARGGILLRGLGYESNEASILTNISADHLDVQGLHTLPELAEVKSVICRITKPTGAVILNADDPLVAAVARRVKAEVCFFSMRPSNPRMRRHLARGRRGLFVEDGWIVEAGGAVRRKIVRVEEVPATMRGAARHNIANALAAAGGARALGATREEVAAGLRSFRPTSDRMPGRMNFYRSGNRIVVIDFAHNPAGLEVILDTIEGVIGKRGKRTATLTSIIGGAGDRPDDKLRSVGRLAGGHSDEVAIKESLHYLRGRTRPSMIGELLVGLAETGVKAASVPVYIDEPTALRAELTTLGRAAATIDDERQHWLVMMTHEDRPGVSTTLADLGFESVADPSELA
jgi:cyanophycin synthetase